MDENEINDVEEHLAPEETPSSGGAREPVAWGMILLLIWAILLIIFSVQNAHQVTVEFLGWDWQMPLAFLMMITALVTLVVTGVGLAYSRRKRRRRREMKEAAQSED